MIITHNLNKKTLKTHPLAKIIVENAFICIKWQTLYLALKR